MLVQNSKSGVPIQEENKAPKVSRRDAGGVEREKWGGCVPPHSTRGTGGAS